MKTWHLLISIASLTLLLGGCARVPPRNTNNVCQIFRQYPDWYWATQDTAQAWNVPISVQMAIMYQESRFNSTAKPARTRLLWIIPWTRPSSAYGYSQALEGTWHEYQRKTRKHNAYRSSFSHASDFIGWFARKAHRELGIRPSDARRLYLAYHEGLGGYQQRTYRKKAWLMRVANKVQRIANRYHRQLLSCQHTLPKKPWWRRIF